MSLTVASFLHISLSEGSLVQMSVPNATKRILVVGGNGFLGQSIALILPATTSAPRVPVVA